MLLNFLDYFLFNLDYLDLHPGKSIKYQVSFIIIHLTALCFDSICVFHENFEIMMICVCFKLSDQVVKILANFNQMFLNSNQIQEQPTKGIINKALSINFTAESIFDFDVVFVAKICFLIFFFFDYFLLFRLDYRHLHPGKFIKVSGKFNYYCYCCCVIHLTFSICVFINFCVFPGNFEIIMICRIF